MGSPRPSRFEFQSVTHHGFYFVRGCISSNDISRAYLKRTHAGFESYLCTRIVDNQVLRLRKKLEPDPAHPIHVQTVHGVGCTFIPEGAGASWATNVTWPVDTRATETLVQLLENLLDARAEGERIREI